MSLVKVDKTEHWFTQEACKDEAGALKLLYEQPQIASKTKPELPGATPLMIALENRASDAVVRKLLDYFPAAAETAHNGSLPLHVAAKLGASGPDAVEHLLKIYPEAARAKEALDDDRVSHGGMDGLCAKLADDASRRSGASWVLNDEEYDGLVQQLRRSAGGAATGAELRGHGRRARNTGTWIT